MTIAYLCRILPILSETFIVREIVALRELGVNVRTFSLYQPASHDTHPEAPDLNREVVVIGRPFSLRFWLAHLRFLLLSPGRYIRCLIRYVILTEPSWENFRRCLGYFAMAPLAAHEFKRAGVTHVHAHFAGAAASVAMMASMLTDIQFSIMAHAYDIFADTLLLNIKLKEACFVATCSDFNVRYLRDRYPEAGCTPIRVVRYGVDIRKFSPRTRSESSAPLVLAVGRLVETKGFQTLIEACSQLREWGVSAQCHIIGEGPERQRLTRLIEKFGLFDDVQLVGRLSPEAVLSYYKEVQLLVQPSCVRANDRDGIPNVLIEALAMEVPVVSTRVSGIPELIVDRVTGRLVEPDDPKGLATAIAELLADPIEASRMARTGRARVEQEFNIGRSALVLKELFAMPAKF